MQLGTSNYVNARIYVIEGQAEALLGRASSFSLEIIKQIKTESSYPCGKCKIENIESLLDEFSDIFIRIGKIIDYGQAIKIDPGVTPVKSKAKKIFAKVALSNKEFFPRKRLYHNSFGI